jgi:hypothetical protein
MIEAGNIEDQYPQVFASFKLKAIIERLKEVVPALAETTSELDQMIELEKFVVIANAA